MAMVPCTVLSDVLNVDLALILFRWSWLLWVHRNVPCTGHYLMRDVLPAGCPDLGDARCPDLGGAGCPSQAMPNTQGCMPRPG